MNNAIGTLEARLPDPVHFAGAKTDYICSGVEFIENGASIVVYYLELQRM